MRISLFAGPGSGKTNLSRKIVAELDKDGHNIELIPEWIKSWAYAGRVPKSFDQLFIFANQLHSEDLLFQSGVKHLVTDSPLVMQCYYAKSYKFPCWKEQLSIAKNYDSVHPALNIFLDRTGIEYKSLGRYETYEQAVERDNEIREFLNESSISYATIPTIKFDEILDYVKSKI